MTLMQNFNRSCLIHFDMGNWLIVLLVSFNFQSVENEQKNSINKSKEYVYSRFIRFKNMFTLVLYEI